MNHDENHDSKRRFFLTRVLPGCALACAGFPAAPVAAQAPSPVIGAGHRFDNPYDKNLTFRQFFMEKYRQTVEVIQAFSMSLGKAETLQMVKTYSEQKSLVFGNTRAQEVPSNDFATYINYFRDPGYQNLMTMQVVQDTPTVFEIRISECLWAATFQELKAQDIGYALVCHADYTWAEGFNPNIRLTRNQTVMQGHAFCNHRYTWEG